MCDNCRDPKCSGMSISAIRIDTDRRGNFTMKTDAEGMVMLGCLAALLVGLSEEYPDILTRLTDESGGAPWQQEAVISLAKQLMEVTDSVIELEEARRDTSD